MSNAFFDSNVLRSDGTDLEFIFDKMSHPARKLRTPASLQNWLEVGGHRTTIWGVDHGVTDVFVAVAGRDDDPHRVHRTSSRVLSLVWLQPSHRVAETIERCRKAKLNQLTQQMPTVKNTNM
jgi:hypothetical protein